MLCLALEPFSHGWPPQKKGDDDDQQIEEHEERLIGFLEAERSKRRYARSCFVAK
jgi:hypothetical protein